ncbi:MAG: glutamate synthase subunit beta [Saprospiraceae bacterium]|nr:glutamate synthase subunit beta [Saprospiraceae bacterium]MCB9319118.1 glutamate synthase subunit beta [Lewinellaceae bacterium]
MGDPKGFLNYTRELPLSRPPEERIHDYKEIYESFPKAKTIQQAARCMDCGTPFCHMGCPLGNVIPEFNDAVYQEKWETAFKILESTNNFPEFTGRICPAPCEGSCVLGINQPAVAIEHIEKSIAEVAWERGYYQPRPPLSRTGKKVAVIGSGPSGLAAADQMNKAGHLVTLFERKDRFGGLLRYGIPDFKLEKWVLDRRLKLMEESGVIFKSNINVGVDISAAELTDAYDAIILCGGSTIPRDLNIPGRELKGVHFAMEFLEQNNRRVAGDSVDGAGRIYAEGKHVIVIGGGDTGSDCVGTSNRHGAATITQLEIMGKPPVDRPATNPWPEWPLILRTSSSHDEGCERQWAVSSKSFVDDGSGKIKALRIVDIAWELNDEGRTVLKEISGSERELPADLVFLAMGYLHPQHQGLLDELGVTYDNRGNVSANDFQTNVDKVFSAGDMRRGQSLVVWAIHEGRQAAQAAHQFLMQEA